MAEPNSEEMDVACSLIKMSINSDEPQHSTDQVEQSEEPLISLQFLEQRDIKEEDSTDDDDDEVLMRAPQHPVTVSGSFTTTNTTANLPQYPATAVMASDQSLQNHLFRQQLLAGIAPEDLIPMRSQEENINTQRAPALLQISNDGVFVPRVPPATFNPNPYPYHNPNLDTRVKMEGDDLPDHRSGFLTSTNTAGDPLTGFRTGSPLERTRDGTAFFGRPANLLEGNAVGENGHMYWAQGQPLQRPAPALHSNFAGTHQYAYGLQGYLPRPSSAIDQVVRGSNINPYGLQSHNFQPNMVNSELGAYHTQGYALQRPAPVFQPSQVTIGHGAYQTQEHNLGRAESHLDVSFAGNTHRSHSVQGHALDRPATHSESVKLESGSAQAEGSNQKHNVRLERPPTALHRNSTGNMSAFHEHQGPRTVKIEAGRPPAYNAGNGDSSQPVPRNPRQSAQQPIIDQAGSHMPVQPPKAETLIKEEANEIVRGSDPDVSVKSETDDTVKGEGHTGSGATGRGNFSILLSLLDHPAIALEVTGSLDVHDLVNLYAMFRPWHRFIIKYMPRIIQLQTKKVAVPSYVFPWRCYRRLYFTRNASTDEIPAGTVVASSQNVTAHAPSFRWLQMITYRKNIVQRIMTYLADVRCGVPRESEMAIMKLWFLMDIPDNRRRQWTIRNPNLWTDLDLFMATFFIVRLDMWVKFRRNNRSGGQRRLILAQPSLTFCWDVMRGAALRNDVEYLRALVRWQYTPPTGEDNVNQTDILGVPVDEVGMLQYEWYGANGERDAKLRRPDEIILLEAKRRELDFFNMYRLIFIFAQREWFTMCERRNVPWDEEVRIDCRRRGANVDMLAAVRLD